MSEKNSQAEHFLTKEYFQKVLENGLSTKNIRIENVEISSGSNAGENYTSNIYRVEVKYRLLDNNNLQYISLIIKNMTLIESYKVEEFQAFQKEVTMYTKIMPKVEKLYKNTEIFVPKYFYSEIRPGYHCIVIQDLKPLGYILADRTKRLDETHCKHLLQKLARYHAGTIVLSKTEPELLKSFDMGAFQPDKFDIPAFQNIFVNGLKQFIEFASNWDGCEKVAEKLKRIHDNFQVALNKHLTPKPDDIRVLNHSDVWTNNMLFKYENGNVIDVRLIDLQVCTNDSLGMDINYFFSTSVTYDLLINKREELVRVYYESFRGGLEELQYSDIPKWEAVRNEVNKREFFGFMAATGITPIIMLDRETSKDSSFDIFLDNDLFNKKRATVFSNPNYVEFMKYSLKRFDELGIFDI